MAANFVATAFLCIAIVLALLFNTVFIITFVRRKRMKTAARLPTNMLLLNLAVVDILAALSWTVFTAVSAALDDWVFPDAVYTCKSQIWFMGFCNLISTHTICLLMFERFLKVFKPSKHLEIFFDLIVAMMVVTMWIFDAVIATFPVWGWGTTKYFTDQYQCAVDYELSTSHMNFSTTMNFGIPGVLSIVFYIAMNVRLHTLKKKWKPGQAIVLEERKGKVAGDTYSDRLKRQYEQFKIKTNNKKKTTKIKEADAVPDDGYRSDSERESSDDDSARPQHDTEVGTAEAGQDRPLGRRRLEPRRIHYLSRSDLVLIHVYGLMWLLYYTCWLLYIIWNYIWVYHVDVNVPSAVLVAAVICSHLSSAVKSPVLLIYAKYRVAVIKTLKPGAKKTTVKVNTTQSSAGHTEHTTEL